MLLLSYYLQADGLNGILGLLPMFAILVVFYFFFIRPQAKKQKEQIQFLDGMQKGDVVVLGSGLIGKINKIEDTKVSVQLNDKTFVEVLKSSVSKELTDSYLSPPEKTK